MIKHNEEKRSPSWWAQNIPLFLVLIYLFVTSSSYQIPPQETRYFSALRISRGKNYQCFIQPSSKLVLRSVQKAQSGDIEFRTDLSYSLIGSQPEDEEIATFAMGCFWCPDAIFGVAKGVIATKVGYSGGSTPSPTYENMGDHTESVQVTFRPSETSYDALLDIFWKNHNPTNQSRKRQYQCIAFPHNDLQMEKAMDSIERQQSLAQAEGRGVLTTVAPFSSFADAEGRHQKRRLNSKVAIMEFLSLGVDDEALKTSYIACRLNGYLGGYGGSPEQFEKESRQSFHLTEKSLATLNFIVRKEISSASWLKGLQNKKIAQKPPIPP